MQGAWRTEGSGGGGGVKMELEESQQEKTEKGEFSYVKSPSSC